MRNRNTSNCVQKRDEWAPIGLSFDCHIRIQLYQIASSVNGLRVYKFTKVFSHNLHEAVFEKTSLLLCKSQNYEKLEKQNRQFLKGFALPKFLIVSYF